MSYSRVKSAVLATLVLYFLAGIATNPFPILPGKGRTEIYPFFSWFLFAKIPNEQSTFTLRLLRYGDTAYNPPLPFSKTSFLFKEIGQSPTQYVQPILKLGAALQRGESGAQQREVVEKIFLLPTRYEIVYIFYDPLEYWMTGTAIKEQILGVFETNKKR